MMYVDRSCYHGCGILSIGMSHPIHLQPTITINNDNVIVFISYKIFPLTNTTKYSYDVLCLLNLCEISN